jgi:GH35 family endo-1,4-beta-xylanase
MKITKKKILEFLKDKGMEYRFEDEDIILKHCIMTDHKKKWHTIVWFEESEDDWFIMCNDPQYDMYDIVPFTSFMYLCEHDIDAIRNKNRN